MANLLTALRILCGVAMLFCPVFSKPFIILYIIAGITDMIDGTVARKTKTVSDFGSKLDTVADFVLVAVCLFKLIPVLEIEAWMLIWIAGIAVIKIINLILGYVVQKKLVAVHSIMNKATGALLFVLPLSLPFIELKYSAVIVCAMATAAAVQEGYYIRTGKEI